MDTTTGRILYSQLIDAWNNKDASAFASLFTDDATCIGFDGSEMHGKREILSSLSAIFKDHPTARYVTIICEIKNLDGKLVSVRAHVGMMPPGKASIDETKNAIQVMVATISNGIGRIILFQNTPHNIMAVRMSKKS
jgi:uncharacterized protein (TIGR02246 family)